MSPATREQIDHGVRFVERNYVANPAAVRAFAEARCHDGLDALANASTEWGRQYAIAYAKAVLRTASRLNELDVAILGSAVEIAHHAELQVELWAFVGGVA